MNAFGKLALITLGSASFLAATVHADEHEHIDGKKNLICAATGVDTQAL